MDEHLDIVNERDEVIGRCLRSEVYVKGMSNYRVINAFIVNSKGELWIPRRIADKRIFPLALDMSVGGHVESGTTYEATFKKEVGEELNWNTDQLSWRELGYLVAGEDGVSSFMRVYEISSDESPVYNPEDFVGYEWLRPDILLQRIEEGERAKFDLPILVKKFYIDAT